MNRHHDLTGVRFGRLVAVRRAVGDWPKPRFICVCDCGNEVIARSVSLKNGQKASCGCLIFTKNGMSNRRVYNVWWGMLERCEKPSAKGYSRYGARGIRVCDRWHDFSAFYADMGDPPPNMTLDRVDNERGYFPENCKWSSHYEQARNKRSTVLLTFNNETMCVKDWARKLGFNQSTLSQRYRKGWSAEKILTTLTKRMQDVA